jgi:hypothetical protein
MSKPDRRFDATHPIPAHLVRAQQAHSRIHITLIDILSVRIITLEDWPSVRVLTVTDELSLQIMHPRTQKKQLAEAASVLFLQVNILYESRVAER